MSVKKLPFIQSVKLATIDESEVVPTTLYYEQGRVYIGREAREKCSSPELLIEDFKVELGKLDPDNPVMQAIAAEVSDFGDLNMHRVLRRERPPRPSFASARVVPDNGAMPRHDFCEIMTGGIVDISVLMEFASP
jgi:hypothetical protein